MVFHLVYKLFHCNQYQLWISALRTMSSQSIPTEVWSWEWVEGEFPPNHILIIALRSRCAVTIETNYDSISRMNLVYSGNWEYYGRADSRLAPSQWETLLQSNNVSHWLGRNLETALSWPCLVSMANCILSLLLSWKTCWNAIWLVDYLNEFE